MALRGGKTRPELPGVQGWVASREWAPRRAALSSRGPRRGRRAGSGGGRSSKVGAAAAAQGSAGAAVAEPEGGCLSKTVTLASGAGAARRPSSAASPSSWKPTAHRPAWPLLMREPKQGRQVGLRTARRAGRKRHNAGGAMAGLGAAGPAAK